MKSKYTITVTNNDTGHNLYVIDADNYKFNLDKYGTISLSTSGTLADESSENKVSVYNLDENKEGTCDHEWTQYQGFLEDTTYCKKCGQPK